MAYDKSLNSPIRSDRKPLQDLIPLEQPLRVLIDPCDICNFRCKFCFQSYDADFKGTLLKPEDFRLIVDNLKEFQLPINIVHLYGFGEPLLNPDIPAYVKILKNEMIAKEVAITTNGSRLTKELSSQLIDNGLDRLSISLNGLNDSDFTRIAGVKVDFDSLYDNIKFFYDNKKSCHLHIKINGDDYSEDEKQRFVDLFKDISDTINIDTVVNIWPDITLKDYSGEGTMYGVEYSAKAVCPQMFYELIIHSDGSVSPCCADYNYGKQNLGNIHNESLKEIWNGSLLNTMRLEELRGIKSSYEACNRCNYPSCASTVNITPYKDAILKKLSDR